MPSHVVEFGNVGKPPEPDGRLDAPAFHRNHAAIWSVLAPFLQGQSGDALEVGSGTGQHVAALAQATPEIVWWPSDVNTKHLMSIAAWRAHARLPNLRAPTPLDLLDADWDLERRGLPREFMAIVCINVLHIAPWPVSQHVIASAARHLQLGRRLFVYGPFMRDGEHTAPSNAEFDAGLRVANPEWGVRDIADLAAVAERSGLRLSDAVAMPANNFVLVFDRPPAVSDRD
jgi:SAM-dependent methyltransferase